MFKGNPEMTRVHLSPVIYTLNVICFHALYGSPCYLRFPYAITKIFRLNGPLREKSHQLKMLDFNQAVQNLRIHFSKSLFLLKYKNKTKNKCTHTHTNSKWALKVTSSKGTHHSFPS